MLAELRTKSQITLPKAIVSNLGLSEGDHFEVYEKDGIICMIPVAVYPKKYVAALEKEVSDLKQRIYSGEQKVYSDIDEMVTDLEGNRD